MSLERKLMVTDLALLCRCCGVANRGYSRYSGVTFRFGALCFLCGCARCCCFRSRCAVI
jgi:hypothetical protein